MHTRKSARIVLLNDRNEIFLFRHTGRRLTYWVTPGGGVEEGETWEEAARRELWEETGIAGVQIGPCLWTRQGVNRIGTVPHLSDERYFLVRCGMPDITSEHQLDNERATYSTSRWWDLAALRSSTETFWPAGLTDLLEPIIAGHLPAPPIRIPE